MNFLSRVAVFIFFFLLAGMAGIFSANSIFAAEKIDINTSPLEDLIKIIHIGEARALELISLRPFSSLDDLARIKGIGEKRVEDIKKQGLAWVSTREPTPEIEPEPSFEPSTKEEIKIIYPAGIVINEILPDPEGVSDAEGEYIELFNKNKEKVNLSGWKIADAMGKESAFYTLPEKTIIGAEEFLVFYRFTTKIILNNGGDNISLIQPNGKVVDSVTFQGKVPKGESYNLTELDWAWSTILTPGRENIIPSQKTQETEEAKFFGEEGEIDINTAFLEGLVKIVHIGKVRAEELISLRPFYSLDDLIRIKGISPERLKDIKTQGLAWVNPELEPPKIEKTESFDSSQDRPLDKGLAAIAEPFQQTLKSLFVFLTALIIAIFSGVIILILKNKLKKNYNKNI